MKQIAIITLLIGFSAFASGQQTAMQYFSQLPDIPGNPCTIDDSARVHYVDNLRAVTDVLNEDVHNRTKTAEKFVKDHRADAEATAMKNAGFEGMDVQKLKNLDTKHMSEAEKKAMIDQLMQQNMNMTYDEAMKLKSKSKDTAYLKGWSKAYSTEQMANADPEKLQADALKNKKMFDLQMNQKYLTDKMNAGWDKYSQMFDSLQKEADTARADLDRQLKPLYAELDSGNINGDRREAIEDQIYKQNMSFCQEYNPRYCKILFDYKEHLFDILLKCDYDTLENVQHEILNYQLGVEDPLYKPGLYALQAVGGYASLLGTVFKYSVTRSWGMRITTND
jgi:hypothetical protein